MQAARVILLRPASWPKHSFGIWLARAAQRLHPKVLAAALANKPVRIAWTVLAQAPFLPRKSPRAADPPPTLRFPPNFCATFALL